MKSVFTAALFASALSTVAADGWGSARSFPNPQNQDNSCSAQQQSGFDWSGLQTGSFSNFGGFSYSGFTCQNSFAPNGGRRGRLLRARDFGGKVIQGTAQKGSGSPSISCQSDNKMSITQFDMTTAFDTDMDFVYSMADGSTCKHTASCSASGSTIQNTQCGGATSVAFQMPSNGKDGGCGFGIHTIKFDCSPPSQPPTTSSSTQTSTTTSQVSTTASTSTVVTTTLSSTTVVTSSTAISTFWSSSSAIPSSSDIPSSASTSIPSSSAFSTTTGASSSTSGVSSSTSDVSSSTSSGISTTTSYVCSTCSDSSTTLGSSTTPVSSTTPGSSPVTGGTSSTTPAASSSAVSSSSVLASTLSTTTAAPCTACQQPSPPSNVPNAPCPPVLPSCLNTWLSIAPQCKSNSDTKCFCPNPDFAKQIISCVSAWAKDDNETQAALSYFAGICADFIPQNPAICTNVPSSITLQPSVPAQTAVVTQSGSTATITVTQPVTTCTFTNTVTASGVTSMVTSVVTVPQVSFVTQAPATTATVSAGSTVTQTVPASVGLIPAQPQAAPATTTSAGPVSSSAVAAVASSTTTSAAVTGVAAASTSITSGSTSTTVTSTTYSTGTTTMSLAKPSNATFTHPSIFTGAASKEQMGLGMVGGVLAIAAFLV